MRSQRESSGESGCESKQGGRGRERARVQQTGTPHLRDAFKHAPPRRREACHKEGHVEGERSPGDGHDEAHGQRDHLDALQQGVHLYFVWWSAGQPMAPLTEHSTGTPHLQGSAGHRDRPDSDGLDKMASLLHNTGAPHL